MDTTDVLTFGLVPGGASLVLLATLERAIGLGLISGKFMRLTLLLLVFQMVGVVSPLLLLSEKRQDRGTSPGYPGERDRPSARPFGPGGGPRRYEGSPDVEYAEPDFLLFPEATPDDPGYDKLYDLHNTGQTGVTPDADIAAPEAWDTTSGDPNTAVAVVDKDVVGTIAAEGNNGEGVTGVNWQAQIMPLKFLGPKADSISGAVRAIDYTVAEDADISNNSCRR